jgi:putative addiction module component (TIGR02574 family)
MATIDVASLSLEERLRLLDELWESLSQTPEAIPITAAQREELDRRMDELNREGPIGTLGRGDSPDSGPQSVNGVHAQAVRAPEARRRA